MLKRSSRAFHPTDGSVCVWIDDRNPDVLCVSFEVDAKDYGGRLAPSR
jgi:hypothetical protein